MTLAQFSNHTSIHCPTVYCSALSVSSLPLVSIDDILQRRNTVQGFSQRRNSPTGLCCRQNAARAARVIPCRPCGYGRKEKRKMDRGYLDFLRAFRKETTVQATTAARPTPKTTLAVIRATCQLVMIWWNWVPEESPFMALEWTLA